MGDMSIAQLWWGTLVAAAMCVCAFCISVCCDSRGISSCQHRYHGISQQRRAGSVKALVEFWKMKGGMTAGKDTGNV